MANGKRQSLLWITGGLWIVCAAVVAWLLIREPAPPAVYSVADIANAREQRVGEEFSLGGELVVGSTAFDPDACTHSFELEDQGAVIAVVFDHCIVPDTFVDRPGLSVRVDGRLDESGVVRADTLIPQGPTNCRFD